MGSCAAPSAKGDDKFITTDYLQQCRSYRARGANGQRGASERSGRLLG
nr:DNA replication protein [Proteus mirabilis]